MAGFTLVELITVIIVMGVVGAIGVSRFFDRSTFDSRTTADQAKTIIRYAQKLAITQNGFVFVRTNGNSFAICSNAACGPGTLITAPGGSNSGTAATRASCLSNGAFVSTWMCEGIPGNVAVAGLNGAFFYFDALGRPYRDVDPVGQGSPSSFAELTLTFTSGTSVNRLIIAPETGYVRLQ